MEAKQLITDYLTSGRTRMMQVATSVDDQPWCSTVYYATDHDLNLIWISKPDRRHSEEIMRNAKVAGVIAYDQQPPQPYVRGVQFEGVAKLLEGDEEAEACKIFIKQLARETTLLDDIRSGRNPHKVYKITVKKYVLFDSQNFPDDPRKEWDRS